MRSYLFISRRYLLATALLLAGGFTSTSYAQDDALYRDLGGTDGIAKLLNAILDRVYADERIAFLFEPDNRGDLHEVLVEQICELSGGPCVYTGLDMVEAHGGMDLKASEFDIFVEDSILGMTDAGVPHTVQNRLLALLAPMRADIIRK